MKTSDRRFHRIRHYGLLARGNRANNVSLARRPLDAQDDCSAPNVETAETVDEQKTVELSCPACGDRMVIIEIFEPGAEPPTHHQRGPPEHRDVPS